MKLCSWCNGEAVIISGFSYCNVHSGKYESRFFEKAVRGKFQSRHTMKKFFMWAFGTDTPKLSDLARWHRTIPGGKWHRHEEGPWHWDMDQDDYIKAIVREYNKMMKCEHIGTVTHSNGARQCPNCHTVWVKDVPEMRKVYGYPQFRVVWEEI